MGLKKQMVLDNGVTVNYHRVASIQHNVNLNTVVNVHSYTSQAKRRELGDDDGGEVYVRPRALHMPYDDTLGIQDAYGWLKGQPGFEGAADVFEEGQPEDGAEGD